MATDVNFGQQQYFGFEPRMIPGCYIWNDAATLSGANGSTVGTWSNSVSSVTITAGGTVSNSVLNNRTVVNFTTAQTWETSPTINLSAYSMFAVSRQTGGTNGRVLQSVTNNQLFGYWNGYKRSFWIDGNPNQLTTAVSDTNWDLMGHTRVAGGAYVFNWNGSTLFSGASSGGNNLTGLAINTGGFPTEDSTCQIAEIIVYSNVLTTSQVGQVEGYLAWKWGLSANLPVGHPYKRNPPAMRMFQPVDADGDTILWFDAADTRTITGTSPVTQWNDKSGRGTNATTGTGTVTTGDPINSQTTLRFGFNNRLYISNVVMPSSQTSAFYVFKGITSNPSGGSGYFIFSRTDDNFAVYSGNEQFASYQNVAAGRSYVVVMGPGGERNWGNLSTTAFINNVNVIATTGVSYASSNGLSLPLVRTDNVSNTVSTASTYQISTSRSCCGDVYTYDLGELVVYNGTSSTSSAQQLEGYLAWKWGVHGSLPTTHPFYNFPPATPLFTPRLLDNCALWFDAADTSTITGSSPVTAWVNKGSISASASTTSGTTTSGNTFNGLNYISFPAGTEMRFTAAINTQARSWFVVSRVTTPFTSNPQFWGPINATATGRDAVVVYSDTSIFILYIGPNGISIPVSGYIANPYNRVGIYAVVNSVTTSLNVLTDNGTPATLVGSEPAANYNTGSAQVIIGTGGYNTGSDIMEIILYYGDLSPSDRRRVEGYLAWKWGLQNNLPTNHPYSKFRP